MKNTGKVITVAASKGGVGKSFVVSNLAYLTAQRFPQKKVVVLDLCTNSSIAVNYLHDPLGFDDNRYATSWLVGLATLDETLVEVLPNLHFLPAKKSYLDYQAHVATEYVEKRVQLIIKKINELKSQFDYVFIDTHPDAYSDLVNYPILSSDFVVIPTQLASTDVIGACKIVNFLKDMREFYPNHIQYGILFNRVHPNVRNFENALEPTIKFIEREEIDFATEFPILGYVTENSYVSKMSLENELFAEKRTNRALRTTSVLNELLTTILNQLEEVHHE